MRVHFEWQYEICAGFRIVLSMCLFVFLFMFVDLLMIGVYLVRVIDGPTLIYQ